VGSEPQMTHGIILKTTNGGVNWLYLTIIDSIYEAPAYYNLFFLNPNTGFVCGYWYKIFKTTNGGISWNGIITPSYGNLTYWAIKFFDEMTGFIAGRYGIMYKTTTGGANWLSYDTAHSYINDMYFFNVNTGFKCDGYCGIYKTTNSGLNWTYKFVLDSLGIGGGNMESIDFIDENTGYVTGHGALFKTTNGGNDWKSVFIIHNNQLWSVKAINNNVYVGCDSNYIMYSSNFGINWCKQILNTNYGFVHSIYFTDSNTGYLCTQNDIFKTTNGGVSVNNLSTEIPKELMLFQNYPNPFNATTKIRFAIKEEGKGKREKTKLVIYDILGKEVQTLVNEELSPGTYEVTFDGAGLSSGIYFYQLSIDNVQFATKKMVILK
jgi:photosystem II stability/assembly factor-like uncharacterized protein